MTTTACDLPDDLATAHELIRELAKRVHTQGHLIAKLQHQLEQLLRHRFGRKSEKLDPAQLLLFAREILAELGAAPAPSPPGRPGPRAGPPGPGPRGGRRPRSRRRRRRRRRRATAASPCRRA